MTPLEPLSPPIVDAVVIGRNEGQRLEACLRSLCGQVREVVYVDSGSTDGSPDLAGRLGVEVIRLDPELPFTAARARNAGLRHLAARQPRADYVQFLDGDCRLQPGWMAAGLAGFAVHPGAVVLCGRRREEWPEASLWNRLCDREWDTPPGEVLACGGDALMKMAAVLAAGGFHEELIAGEEPELCQRLRRAGGQIWRISAEMSLHDARMLRFSQWWRRMRRAGHAFADGAALHGAGPDRFWRRERRRALFWGLVLPLLALVLSVAVHPLALLLLALWPLQMLRLAWRWRGEGWVGGLAAVFTVLGKPAEALGVLDHAFGRLRGRRRRLIEYR